MSKTNSINCPHTCDLAKYDSNVVAAFLPRSYVTHRRIDDAALDKSIRVQIA